MVTPRLLNVFLLASVIVLPIWNSSPRLSLTAPQQTQQAPYPAGQLEGVSTEEWTVERRDAAGKREVGRQWLHAEVRYHFEPTPTQEVIAEITCAANCDGTPNHGKHDLCDVSCDAGCSRTHKVTASGGLQSGESGSEGPLYAAVRSVMLTADYQSDKVGKKRLAADLLDTQLWSAFREVHDFASTEKTVVFPHFVDTKAAPCYDAEGIAVKQLYTMVIDIVVIKNTGFGVDVVREELDSRTIQGPKYWFFNDKLSNAGIALNCYCGPEELKDRLGRIPSNGEVFIFEGTQVRRVYRFPDYFNPKSFESEGNKVIEKSEKDSKIKIYGTGKDLNVVNLVVENKSDKSIRVMVKPGMIFVPKKQATQNMVVGVGQEINVGPGETKNAPVRVLCAEKGKLEPGEKDVFALANSTDDLIPAICKVMQAERFRGPWDQARLWIHTDKASLSDINERLSPGIPAARYVNLLFELAKCGALSLKDPAVMKLIDPNLINGSGARPEAVEWIVGTLAKSKPKELAEHIAKDAGFLKLCQKPDENIDTKHCARVTSSLCQTLNKITQLAGLKVLLNSIPSEKRKEITESNGLAGTGALVNSQDPEVAENALEVVDVYSHKIPEDSLKMAAKYGPSQKVREKATKMLAAN